MARHRGSVGDTVQMREGSIDFLCPCPAKTFRPIVQKCGSLGARSPEAGDIQKPERPGGREDDEPGGAARAIDHAGELKNLCTAGAQGLCPVDDPPLRDPRRALAVGKVMVEARGGRTEVAELVPGSRMPS